MNPLRHTSGIVVAVVMLLASASAGCGVSIGDSCGRATDCSDDGDRICDTSAPGGYCTVEGCDFDTCPSEAVCVRFFPVTQLAQSCESNDDCSLEELCTGGKCAPRSTERRFCMKSCSSQGSCRDDYECRDPARQASHGGGLVTDPDVPVNESVGFCAQALPCTSDADCDLGDTCDVGRRYCRPS